jgi:hypothetical protein
MSHRLASPNGLGDFSVECGGKPIPAFPEELLWRKIQLAKGCLSLVESVNYRETRAITFRRALSGNCRAQNLG